jgi:hypothetical protein
MTITNTNIRFRYNIRIIVITVLFLFTSVHAIYAQGSRDEAPPLRERIFFGGNVGLQFGTITDIQVSPVVGLWLLPRLSVAAGPDYRYYKDPYNGTSIYGGKAYLQLVVLKNINSVIPVGANTNIVAHLEDELLSLKTSFWKNPPYTSDRFYLNSILAGGGISQEIGRRASLDLLVLWVLNESQYSVYNNPEIRISFTF